MNPAATALSWSAAGVFAVFLVLVLARITVAERASDGSRYRLRRLDLAAGLATVLLIVLLTVRVLAEL
ncbi:hypothetical protein [Amycolatopsis nigrescens]|uniref:hypothetical protein n=1 Tax=Amycolatopsis nigrescens TaxID=381445 RepID=UPI0003754A47|nr:hypothetical protein [Amycolatopsis nigrescens]